MTIYQSKLARLRALKEASFGADTTGSMGSHFEVPFIEGSDKLNLIKPVQTPGHSQQRIDGYPLGVIMPKSATLELSYNFSTATTKATSTVASTHTWLTRLLEIAFGSVHQSTGTTFSSGWTTVTGNGGTVTTIRPGSAIGWVNTSGIFEARGVKTKSGSALTTRLAFSGAPANTNVLYGGTTIYPNTRETGIAPSIQFLYEGWNTEHRWLLLGGWLESITLSLAPGTIPTMTCKWAFAQHFQADGALTAGDFVGPVLSASTYTDTNTIVVVDSEFRVQTLGTSTLSGSLYHPSEIVFEFPGLIHEPVRTPAGTQTVLGTVRTHNPPLARGSFTLPYEDSQEWFTARDSRTAKSIAYQMGTNIAIGAVLLSAPNTQIVDVQPLDVGGVLNQKVDWVTRLDTDVTAESGYEGLAEAAFRADFF